MNTAALVASLLVILAVELPDKTLMATLVLSSRYRHWPVLVGVSAAFLVQCVIAVSAGGLITLLPTPVVLGVVTLLFAVGAALLFRESFGQDDESPADAASAPAARSFFRIALTCFGVLFAAEWGDASQLATVALVARYNAPIEVFIGSFVALVGVAAIAVVLGRIVLKYIPLKWVQRGAAVMFTVFTLISLYGLIRSL